MELEDHTDDIALLALQGPRAEAILRQLTDADLDAIRYYHFAEGTVDGMPATISRTGYTGEDGFELYVARGARGQAVAPRCWRWARTTAWRPRAWAAATRCAWRWATRSTATTWTRTTTPLEAGLGWVVKMDKGDFVGRDALARQKEQGIGRKLVGLPAQGAGLSAPRLSRLGGWAGVPAW